MSGGSRTGHGWRGKTGPRHRVVCTRCGKHGMTAWRAAVTGSVVVYARHCRYCFNTESREVGDLTRPKS